MATWLTHLRIAEKIKENIPGISLPYLMIGSIAPDSGKPDETFRSYTPPKEVTHFKLLKEDDRIKIDLDAFYQKYLEPSKIITRSDNTRSFLWGYYFHLVADKLWSDKYLYPNKKIYDAEDHQDKDFIDIMREEIYSLDFHYLDQNGKGILDKFKTIKAEISFFNEFDPSYIYECQRKISDYYDNKQYKLDREYRFYTLSSVEEFVKEAAQRCLEILL